MLLLIYIGPNFEEKLEIFLELFSYKKNNEHAPKYPRTARNAFRNFLTFFTTKNQFLLIHTHTRTALRKFLALFAIKKQFLDIQVHARTHILQNCLQ